ncbi:leucine-rich repeat domain-containing protein [Entomomonas asaccharolytica]|uniref:Leucine-rich repeat domain-containing protein n=1 Tax=Entomomonas asaccharolytica TaxID=2785331 RepID=A0A974NE23_9GAMM|nr:leucine-rich repeat domain-containing protein [Entomomonas asaccharolytica]QQP84958.1 leucine-rich repeat domain-containing protein [Entomomonas asaccharolytica]
MVDLAFLQNKLQTAPAGFGYADVGQWLQDVPHIELLADIKPLFFEALSKKELLAFITLLKHRYIKDGPAYNLFQDHFEEYIKQNGLEDFYHGLYLYKDSSQCLDFTVLTKALTKLVISTSDTITTVIIPAGKQLEALELSYLAQLQHLQQIEQAKGLMYLAVNQCPQLTDFSFIKKLKKLVWLDLSGNQQLTDLSFLLASSQIVFLQLLDMELLDNPKVFKQLSKLKYLKYLTISGKQTQITELRKQLPNCVVNGISAINNQSY